VLLFVALARAATAVRIASDAHFPAMGGYGEDDADTVHELAEAADILASLALARGSHGSVPPPAMRKRSGEATAAPRKRPRYTLPMQHAPSTPPRSGFKDLLGGSACVVSPEVREMVRGVVDQDVEAMSDATEFDEEDDLPDVGRWRSNVRKFLSAGELVHIAAPPKLDRGLEVVSLTTGGVMLWDWLTCSTGQAELRAAELFAPPVPPLQDTNNTETTIEVWPGRKACLSLLRWTFAVSAANLLEHRAELVAQVQARLQEEADKPCRDTLMQVAECNSEELCEDLRSLVVSAGGIYTTRRRLSVAPA